MHTPVPPPRSSKRKGQGSGLRGTETFGPLNNVQTASVIPGERRLSCETLVHGTSLSFHHHLSTDQQKSPKKTDALACQGPGAGKVPTPSFSQRPGCSSGCGRL